MPVSSRHTDIHAMHLVLGEILCCREMRAQGVSLLAP